METIKTLLKRKLVLAALGVVIVVGGYYGYKHINKTQAAPKYVTEAVTKGNLIISVSGSGQVSSSNQVDLKPSGSGKITSVKVKVGQAVKTGDVIATLEQTSTANQVRQAQVALMQAQVAYDKLVAGATDSDLLSNKISVESAQQALDKARADLEFTKEDQQRQIDKAHNTLLNSGLALVPSDALTTASVVLSGSYVGTTEGSFALSLFTSAAGLRYQVNGLSSATGAIDRGEPLPLGNGLYVTFGTSGSIDSSSRWTIDVPNKTSSSYSSNLYAYQTAQINAPKEITAAEDTITSAENNLKKAQNDLSTKQAPPENIDIKQAQVQIDSARLQLANAQSDYANNIIRAPFDGLIADLPARLGDQASSGGALATIITKEKIAEITLNEVDVAKIQVGQKVTLTFDAIDGLTIAGQIREVGLVGTATQGVVSYTVKIGFDTDDDRVKPGMSVSAAIITDLKQDVLLVPTSAVKAGGAGSYVQTLENGSPVNHTIEVGSSNDTQTEVTGDIKEGDEVVTQTITATTQTSAIQSTQQRAGGGFGGLGGGGAAGGNVRVFQTGR